MRFAYVLYIGDSYVGPAFEVIRRVCDPRSHSRPHITVRYPVDKLLENNLTQYERVVVPNIDIIEGGTFSLHGSISAPVSTVFIRCASDILETLAYKPHFPDSVFHITLYDGESASFATKLADLVCSYPWHFRLELPENTKLQKLEIRRSRDRQERTLSIFPERLRSWYRDITSESIDQDLIESMSDSDRLRITKQFCDFIHRPEVSWAKLPQIDSTVDDSQLSGGVTQTVDTRKYLAFNQRITRDNEILQPDLTNRLDSGLFLTPPELAREIVAFAVKSLGIMTNKIDFGDPAIGTGVFFSALREIISDVNIGSALGIEIDAERVLSTQQKWGHRQLHVRKGDYLHMESLPPRSLIVANPPYVRYQRIPVAYRERLRERASVLLGMQISGMSSLYVYFMMLSHAWMLPNAVAAWLIPSEFMETNYGSVVRSYLTEKVELIRLHKFNARQMQFENALVSSTVVVFRNRFPTRDHQVHLSTNGSIESPETFQAISVSDLRVSEKWTVPIRHRSVEDHLVPRISDLFTVKRGLATGANDFFILSRANAEVLRLPSIFLKPILPKARKLTSDIIEKAPDGYPDMECQLCLLDCDLPTDEICRLYPDLMYYLESAPPSVRSGALIKKRKLWYQQEKRDPAQFLCTYMGRGSNTQAPLRFVLNRSNAVASNTYLMLYPRPKLSCLLDSNPKFSAELFQVLKLTEGPNLLDQGREYGGGLHKIEPRELLSLRFEDCPKWLKDAMEERLPL